MMDDPLSDIGLRCVNCSDLNVLESLTEFERESENVVRCGKCGKRHSTASLEVRI